MSKYVKNTEKPIQKIRFVAQTAFAILCVWIGIEFYIFIQFLESGGIAGSSYRPAGVEGFLPISALMNVYYFFLTGELHSAHPAGFFILLAIIGVSFVIGKSFCSWSVPLVFFRNLLEIMEKREFGKNY